MVRKSENFTDKEIGKASASSDNNTEKFIHTIMEKLKQGNMQETMSLLAKGQARHILDSTPDLPKRLVEIMGKKMTDKLIDVFVHSPCLFCKKGRVTCENCDGHGHIDYRMVCTDCLSLGLVKCNFCDGSGWSTIDSIPAGLRALVLYQRTKVAEARIKKILLVPITNLARHKSIIILKKYAQLLMDLDRYLGVLENTVTSKKELIRSRYWSRAKVKEIVISCIQTAIDAEGKAREIVERIAEIVQMQAESLNEDSDAQKLAAVRTEFYESLLDSSYVFGGTSLEHPFLNDAAKKLGMKNNSAKKDDELII